MCIIKLTGPQKFCLSLNLPVYRVRLETIILTLMISLSSRQNYGPTLPRLICNASLIQGQNTSTVIA